MGGVSDLGELLASMQPELHDSAHVFCCVDEKAFGALPLEPIGLFREEEGVTVITTEDQARSAGLPFETTWARITLTVHSSLTAVGFIAEIARRLAEAGISLNPVSAYYHDHLFVPWERRVDAMECLRRDANG